MAVGCFSTRRLRALGHGSGREAIVTRTSPACSLSSAGQGALVDMAWTRRPEPRKSPGKWHIAPYPCTDLNPFSSKASPWENPGFLDVLRHGMSYIVCPLDIMCGHGVDTDQFSNLHLEYTTEGTNPMPTTRLNASTVAALKPRDATYITYDTVARGFGVRATPAGAKSYVLTYRLKDGRQRRMTIGRVDRMRVVDARREAQTLLLRIGQGEDPLAEMRRRPARRRWCSYGTAMSRST